MNEHGIGPDRSMMRRRAALAMTLTTLLLALPTLVVGPAIAAPSPAVGAPAVTTAGVVTYVDPDADTSERGVLTIAILAVGGLFLVGAIAGAVVVSRGRRSERPGPPHRD